MHPSPPTPSIRPGRPWALGGGALKESGEAAEFYFDPAAVKDFLARANARVQADSA